MNDRSILEQLIDALCDSDRKAEQIRESMMMAYKMGKNDGALDALTEVLDRNAAHKMEPPK